MNNKNNSNNDNEIMLALTYTEEGADYKVSIDDYIKFVENKSKDQIADFIFYRLFSRYLKPFNYKNEEYINKYKNGFSIMANCCLLIETMECFKRGWGDSRNKSEKLFIDFFKTDNNFRSFQNNGQDFYVNVRCAILHQGETSGGYRIRRDGNEIFKLETKTIDAVLFSQNLEKSLKSYTELLKNVEWDSELWDNCRTKMRKIIANC